MSCVKIITNNKPRDIVHGFQLDDKARKEFDYLSDDDFLNNEFFLYKGQYYDLNEFVRVRDIDELKGWSGYSSDSYFSGVLVKYCNDYESVIVATYYS